MIYNIGKARELSMSAQLSYAPVIEFQDGDITMVEAAHEFGRNLRNKELPACIVRRSHGISLGMAIKLSEAFTERGILPVIEIEIGDDVLDLRNLFETSVLGTVKLQWENGQAAFDHRGIYELVDNAGRHRLPLDLLVTFNDELPDPKEYRSIVRKIGELADKYGHVQIVKLMGMPENGSGQDIPLKAGEHLKMLLDVCPRCKAATSPELWIKHREIRDIAGDLGLVSIDREKSSIEEFVSVELKKASDFAESIGLAVFPRLPLVPRFYFKGWHSFDVGKVLDSWVDRKIFNRYRNRPGWLED